MLIFKKGLRILFKDHSDNFKAGIIRDLSTYVDDSTKRYIVDVYCECDKLSDDSYYVLESQILQVWIKDTDGFGVWVRLDDLYTSYPNGTIIGPDTRYKYNAELGRNSGRHPFSKVDELYEYAKEYLANDEKATKATINRVCGYRINPNPKKVIFNGPATIVMWQDGTKTIVKKSENDTDDREKAVMYAILKKLCGKKAAMDRYLKQFKVNFYDLKEVESNEEKAD